MAETTAVAGQPKKNNSTTILNAGNVTRTDVENLTLATNAVRHTSPRVVESPSQNIGVTYAISGNPVQYDPPASEWVAKVLSSTVGGASNTVLQGGASDVGNVRTDKGVGHERLDITSWDYETGAATFGAGRGVNIVQSGIDNTTGPTADNAFNQAEFTYFGPGNSATNVDFPTRNG